MFTFARRLPPFLRILLLGLLLALTAIAHADIFYVTNSGNNTVTRYATNGAYLGVFISNHLNSPSALAFSSSGNLFVANLGDNTIVQFAPDGTYVGVFASVGVSDPLGIAFAPNGHLFVCNGGGMVNVTQYAPNGAYLGAVGSLAEGVEFPVGVAFSGNGNLFLLNEFHNMVTQYAPDGTFVGAFHVADFITATESLAFSASGNLFVTELNNTISQYSPTGVSVGTFASTGLNSPKGLVFSSSGNLFVVNSGYSGSVSSNFSIAQFNGTTGAFVGYFPSAGQNIPTFIAAVAPPAFSQQPANQTVTMSSGTTFTAAAGGHAVYQWQRKHGSNLNFGNLTNAGPFSGVTTGTLAVTYSNLTLSGDRFRLLATNGGGASYSNQAVLTVNSPLPPVFLTQPQNRSSQAGTFVTFTATASNSPLYRWQRKAFGTAGFINLNNSSVFSGVSTTTLTVGALTTSLNGSQFRCVASNHGGTAFSQAAAVEVQPYIVIFRQPVPISNRHGATVRFTVSATGPGTLQYQWLRNDVPLKNSSRILNATTATLTLKAITPEDAGNYTVTISTPGAPSVTSTIAVLTIIAD
jgi:sugar lactone lactonase YvrE